MTEIVVVTVGTLPRHTRRVVMAMWMCYIAMSDCNFDSDTLLEKSRLGFFVNERRKGKIIYIAPLYYK